jgi:signal peptidase II
MDITHPRWRLVFLLFVLVACVGCDQATKHYAVENLKGTPPQSYLGDTFRIQYAENTGAFLSLGANLPAGVRFWLLTVVNGLVLAVVGAVLLLRREMDGLSIAALTLILAGGVGNLIDRLTTQNGVVIDFLNVGIGGLRTGVFNVADMAISAGFVLLLPLVFRRDDSPPVPADR